VEEIKIWEALVKKPQELYKRNLKRKVNGLRIDGRKLQKIEF
jgi:hypothetical protein